METPSPILGTQIEPVSILIVDDEARNLEALESILDAPGQRVVKARTAQEALIALLRGEFAAIVLDIKMPDVSGFELAKMIKQRKRTRHIPSSSSPRTCSMRGTSSRATTWAGWTT